MEVDKYLPKGGDFADTVTITSNNFPKNKLKVTRVDEVVVRSGPRAGQECLVMEVQDDNGTMYTYWPNKTSIGTIASKLGNNSDKWIGERILLTAEKMIVRGQRQTVLFAEVA